MTRTGKIAPGQLPGLLRDLYLERRTGLLEFSRGKDHGNVCFVNGQVAWGESSIPECQLGPTLTRHGIVSQQALDTVAGLVGEGKRLGTLLVEDGHLDATRLDEALTLHVRETLRTIFGWQDGYWSFEERAAEDFAAYAGALRIPTGDLILDAVWSVADPDVVRYQLGDLERVLALSSDPLLRFQRITLTPTDAFFLSRIDGMLTAREVLELSPVGAEEARRSLFGLLSTGLAEFVVPAEPSPPVAAAAPPPGPPPTPEEVLALYRALPTRNHFDLLGIDPSATTAEIHEEFVRRARRFNPAAQRDPRLRSLQTELETICARLAEAERVLSDAYRRAAYGEVLRRGMALAGDGQPATTAAAPERPREDPEAAQARQEQQLAQADQLLEEGRPWDALQAVEGVLAELAEGQSRSRSKALLLRVRVYLKNPNWRKESERLLKELVAQEPGNADAFFLLGELYKQEGIPARAAAMFRKVLELKPRHEGARAELGPETKPGSGASGWLRWRR